MQNVDFRWFEVHENVVNEPLTDLMTEICQCQRLLMRIVFSKACRTMNFVRFLQGWLVFCLHLVSQLDFASVLLLGLCRLLINLLTHWSLIIVKNEECSETGMWQILASIKREILKDICSLAALNIAFFCRIRFV